MPITDFSDANVQSRVYQEFDDRYPLLSSFVRLQDRIRTKPAVGAGTSARTAVSGSSLQIETAHRSNKGETNIFTASTLSQSLPRSDDSW